MSQAAVGRETREMRMTSRLLGGPGHLATFIASRRRPGADWKTWNEIGHDLHPKTGETFTPEVIRKWAKRYGIPEYTRPGDSAELTAMYLARLAELGITIPGLNLTKAA